ncbi:MAG TPA: alpha/beta fold hydrolase [Gammaproteobacteria bacterium]|jgi:pimeloyl-[acyl-carrier protein] methyl ester esterase
MKGLKSKITGKGPNLVLLHGWSMNSEVWQPVLPLLEGSFTVHRIDLPGHGINADCFPGDRLEDWAGAAVSVIPASSIVIGWSLGGLLALAIARHNPACITRLGLIGCSPKFTADTDWPHAVPADLLDEFGAGLNEADDKTVKRFIKLVALGDPGAVQLSRRLQSIVNRNAQAIMPALRAGLRLLRDEDLRQIFRGLARPLWVALGDADRLVPVEVVAGLVQLNETVRIDVFENCGHIPFMSYPEMFVRRMRSWLGE